MQRTTVAKINELAERKPAYALVAGVDLVINASTIADVSSVSLAR